MKKEIDEFKRQNGNMNYTLKEMIMYLVTRVDKIDDRLECGTGKIASTRATVKYLTISIGFIIGALGIIFTWMLQH